MRLPERAKLMVLAPLVRGMKGEHREIFGALAKQGFARARVDGELVELNALEPPELKKTFAHDIAAVVDRIVLKPDIRGRVADSVETALRLSQGTVVVAVGQEDGSFADTVYSEKFACPLHPHVSLPELEPRLFSFNSPHGACPDCHGLGTTMEFDPELVVPDDALSLENGAVEAWRKQGKRMNIYYSRVLRTFCRDFGVSYSAPVKEFEKDVMRALLMGTAAATKPKAAAKKGAKKSAKDSKPNLTTTYFEGVIPNLQRRFESSDSDSVKTRLAGYMSEQACATCCGTRLRPEALAVRIETAGGHSSKPGCETPDLEYERSKADELQRAAIEGRLADNEVQVNTRAPSNDGKRPGHEPAKLPGYSIDDVARMTVERARQFFEDLRLTSEGATIAEPVVREVGNRLGFMFDVGLGYLSLDRKTGSLSGGEAQRIRLATQVGSKLVGVCYVLDEPTIGLHQRDNDRLIRTLHKLRDLGNTVLMVEHDEDCIRASDYLIDIGPAAGSHGGKVVAAGPIPDVYAQRQSTTVKYLTGELAIRTPETRRPVGQNKMALELKGATANNLRDVDVRIPLGGLVCVTGVSGSGKSTLINQTLLPALKRKLLGSRVKAGAHRSLNGTAKVDKVIEIDQSPIGRTPRSNPATYTGVFDEVRKAFAKTREAKIRGYEVGRFSFNVKGGRCESCQGQGTKLIEMHFLPDVYVECEVCGGTRYNAETLEVKYRGKSIADVLALTIEESLSFFDSFPQVTRMLKALNDVGLGYVRLGQPSTQLSGGEAQRVKLASELGKSAAGHTLYMLDEPTTGLHFADINNLLSVLNRLADKGNTVLVIEHNLDVIKCADWVIDMGPEGGRGGGTIVAEGTPEAVVAGGVGYTAEYLAKYLAPAGGGEGGEPVEADVAEVAVGRVA